MQRKASVLEQEAQAGQTGPFRGLLCMLTDELWGPDWATIRQKEHRSQDGMSAPAAGALPVGPAWSAQRRATRADPSARRCSWTGWWQLACGGNGGSCEPGMPRWPAAGEQGTSWQPHPASSVLLSTEKGTKVSPVGSTLT
jgi:hypothetical protein